MQKLNVDFTVILYDDSFERHLPSCRYVFQVAAFIQAEFSNHIISAKMINNNKCKLFCNLSNNSIEHTQYYISLKTVEIVVCGAFYSLLTAVS